MLERERPDFSETNRRLTLMRVVASLTPADVTVARNFHVITPAIKNQEIPQTVVPISPSEQPKPIPLLPAYSASTLATLAVKTTIEDFINYQANLATLVEKANQLTQKPATKSEAA